MKGRKLSWVSAVVVIMILVSLLFTFGCKDQSTTTANTLKVGLVAPFSMADGLNFVHEIELLVDLENQNGGIEIGGERYNIELIIYDNNMEQAKDIAAINRLVYEDEVDYIFADSPFIMAWLNTTETERILVFTYGGQSEPLGPDYNYVFSVNGSSASGAAVLGWFCENHPDDLGNVVVAYPEGPYAEIIESGSSYLLGAFGVTATFVSYPANTADLSAVATKVVSLNPTLFWATGGGDLQDSLACKAVWDAGYRGRMFSPQGVPVEVLAQTLPAGAAEGFISGSCATDFEPGLTDAAVDFKAAWVDQYGQWDGVNTTCASLFTCLKAALEEAGTIDVDAVAEVISNGLVFESPAAESIMMVSRPDLGNDRTVDSVMTAYIKVVVDGEAELVDTISPEEVLAYFRIQFPPQ